MILLTVLSFFVRFGVGLILEKHLGRSHDHPTRRGPPLNGLAKIAHVNMSRKKCKELVYGQSSIFRVHFKSMSHICIHIYIHTYIYIYTHTYIHTYIYIYIYIIDP